MGLEAVIATQVIDTTSVGRAVMTAADAAAARTAIGAGTSSFDGAYSSLSGIPSTFAPSSHTHGNITNAGAIGSTASLPVITGTSGVLEVGSFGTTAGTFCQGNDARLSDARTPTAHTHTAAAITDFSEAVDDEVATLLTAGTNITITYNDAANTLTIASTAGGGSPGGSSGQVQFNSAGSFGGAAAVVYAASGTHVAITAQATGSIPLCVKAVASQTGNLFESQISTGAVRAKINAAGDFTNPRTGNEAECFGASSNAGEWGTALGKGAVNNSGYGFAGGRNANAGSAAVAVGAGSSAIDDCVAAGYTANAGHARCYVFGRGGASTAANQVIFVDATHLLLTGTTAKFSTSTSFEAFQIDRNATAGQTRLLLWDIDKGSLQRVSIGASDSGGTGFKVLRVPN